MLFGQEHVERYRSTDGEEGHDWQGTQTLLLTTTGRKSGEQRTTPLIYGATATTCSSSPPTAAPQPPALVSQPRGQPRGRRADLGRAVPRPPRASRRLTKSPDVATMAGHWPAYDDYQRIADREIPVVVIERARSSITAGRSAIISGWSAFRHHSTQTSRIRATPTCPDPSPSATGPPAFATSPAAAAGPDCRRGLQPAPVSGEHLLRAARLPTAPRPARSGTPTSTGSQLPEGALKDGAQVVIGGGPDYYPGSQTASPSFNFRATHIRLAGEGDLLAQLARLRRSSTPTACSSASRPSPAR